MWKKKAGREHKTHSAVSRGIGFLLHHMLKNKCRSTVLNLGGAVAQALILQQGEPSDALRKIPEHICMTASAHVFNQVTL